MLGSNTENLVFSVSEVRNESLFVFGGMILFCFPLLILPAAPIPKPVILSEPFEGDLLLWKMESSLRDDFI